MNKINDPMILIIAVFMTVMVLLVFHVLMLSWHDCKTKNKQNEKNFQKSNNMD